MGLIENHAVSPSSISIKILNFDVADVIYDSYTVPENSILTSSRDLKNPLSVRLRLAVMREDVTSSFLGNFGVRGAVRGVGGRGGGGGGGRGGREGGADEAG